MTRPAGAAILAVALAVALAACVVLDEPDLGPLYPEPPDASPGDRDGGAAGACGDSDPTVHVSFAAQIRPLTTRGGGGCGCHRTSAPGGFTLGTYAALRQGGANSGPQIVIPGDPCASILVQKLGVAPPFGARMPYNGPPFFTAEELQLVRDWIAEGALDN